MWNICFLFLCSIGRTLSYEDQCIYHNTVPGEFNRSETNDHKVDRAHAHCDTFPDGWYRFRTNEIATSCVPHNHCGTISTVWMKDPVPKIGQTLERSFCVNHGDPGNCCLFSFMVNVTNCDGLLVYNFLKGDLLCPSAFCTEVEYVKKEDILDNNYFIANIYDDSEYMLTFESRQGHGNFLCSRELFYAQSGNLAKCKNNQKSATGFEPCTDNTIPCPPDKTSPTGFEPCTAKQVPCKSGQTSSTGFEPCTDINIPCKNGQTSPTGFEPCTDPLPVMSRPVLHAPSFIADHTEFVQDCDVGYTGSDPHVAFWVTWLFDGVKHRSLELTGGTNKTRISSADWIGNIGKKLTCMVEAQVVPGKNNAKTAPLTSNEYHGTVTMFQSQLPGENDMVTVTLTSTLPPVCSRVPSVLCKLDMELMIRGRDADSIDGVDGCFARFWAKDWDAKLNKVTTTTKIHLGTNPTTTAVYEITFKGMADSLGHQMWKHYVMSPVQLNIYPANNSPMRGRRVNRYTDIDEITMDDQSSVWICKCLGQNTHCGSHIIVPPAVTVSNTISPPLVG